ncbi:hypothetical protein Naga_101983g1 [Nannochloropsis gaditana]|uniref:Uncharacterized protein n=1 Tax=Nannochloropsis gaditana TaxID=72520 RepID=W7SYY8_9STRA|nr:hypothetical protein Naga_101983g1 [Nannochloropsis gaditana]
MSCVWVYWNASSPSPLPPPPPPPPLLPSPRWVRDAAHACAAILLQAWKHGHAGRGFWADSGLAHTARADARPIPRVLGG